MANLTDGFKYLSDDDMRMQLALISCVNLVNAAKETGYRIISGLADMANAFTEAFSRKTPFEYEVKRVSDMVTDEYIKLKAVSREELEKMLITRIKNLSGLNAEEDNPDLMSKKITDDASGCFGINKYKTTAHKIEEISIEYNNAFLKALHTQLVKMTVEEFEASMKILGERLAKVSLESKRQLQTQLVPTEFNSKGILMVLRKEKGTRKLEYAVNILGVEAFDYISAEVRTMIELMKGLNRMSSIQLARFTWKVSLKYGKKFYISEDLLPSYVPADLKSAQEKEEKEYIVLLEGRKSDGQAVEKLEREYNRQLEILEKYENELNKQKEKMDSSNQTFSELEQKKEEYLNNNRPETETKSYYSSVNSAKRSLDNNKEEYDRRNNRYEQQKENVNRLLTQLDEAKQKYADISAMSDRSTEIKATALMRLWQAYFYKFTFDNKVFKSVVTSYKKSEILQLEAALKELMDCKKMNSVADDTEQVPKKSETDIAETEDEDSVTENVNGQKSEDNITKNVNGQEPEDNITKNVNGQNPEDNITENINEQETETVYIKKVYVGVKKYATVKYEGHNIFEIV
ncbi:MAG: hypothetical protein PUD10_06345 [Lachnospira sp.]|nr:hypothetical protein [Lachnospira sp.]